VDDSENPEQEKNIAAAHFDGERFQEGQDRIIRLRNECIANLKQGKASLAREKPGRLLHTLQDFYSHTNWVEQGNTDISLNIGFVGGVAYPRDPIRANCRNRVSFFPSPAEQTAYDLNNECLNLCKKGDDTIFKYGLSARYVLGDWKAYTFWASSSPQPPISATDDICHPYECKDNLLGGFSSYVTSGYYGGSHDENSMVEIQKPNPDKCTHGGVADTFAHGLEGINKDSLNPVFSPHWRDHPTAAGLAINTQNNFWRFWEIRKQKVQSSRGLNCVFYTALEQIAWSLSLTQRAAWNLSSRLSGHQLLA
jgi:hypothetical protein